jgi:hypothetical protein
MTFPFVGPVEVPTPTANTHPTTKLYVDNGLAGKEDAGHVHAHPLVPNPPISLDYAASLTPPADQGNYRVVAATGNLTLNAPSGGTDGQMLRIRVIASGASRTVTFDAGLRRPTAIGSSLVIGSGKRGDIGLLYEAADGWTVLAAQPQA